MVTGKNYNEAEFKRMRRMPEKVWLPIVSFDFEEEADIICQDLPVYTRGTTVPKTVGYIKIYEHENLIGSLKLQHEFDMVRAGKKQEKLEQELEMEKLCREELEGELERLIKSDQ